ncbi:putative cobalt transporter subunit CbtB [Pseudomonas syringae pv. delphinii]|nr:putative cobalt transporter subunit CbtB [Pseudomonas syringae pv. delphinii]
MKPLAFVSGFACAWPTCQHSRGNAMSTISSSQTAATSSTQTQRLTAAISAALLGACLVYFAGFSHIAAVHNAAHDTRHSAAFPCH